MKRHFTYLAAMLLAGTAAQARTIDVAAGPDAQTRLQEALITAERGDVVMIGAGTFDLTDGLSLANDGVTVRGAGMERTILNFAGQQGAGEGLLVTSDDVVLRDFTVRDTRGDGIKSKGADRIVYLSLRVDWSGEPRSTNGSYGVYPVESEHVLIDGVIVRGASDAGIYVGQARNIIVRDSVAVQNVAGIEIENSFNADVHDNIATGNAGGILVFDLPGLPQQGGHSVRIYDNTIINNMTPNFAPPGNIVAQVPTGTGVIVMANRDVEIFDNLFEGNGTANIMITGYRYGAAPEGYQPLPTRIRAQDNLHGRTGFAPALPGGEQLAAAFGGSIPPVLWDGAGSDIKINDPVAAMTLGLADLAQPRDAARPAPVDLTGEPGWARVMAVTLPASMEAAAALP
jgi:parallel beta-helix repeat protein